MTSPIAPTRAACEAYDRADPLAQLREQFELPPGVIYLDGNSLGALPKPTAQRVATAVRNDWGSGLIRSWNTAGWMHLPGRVGDLIARLIGANPGEVIATDSTSVNLYKVLHAAMAIGASGQRRTILTQRDNFPTDLYMAAEVCRTHGGEMRMVREPEVAAAIDSTTAIVMLTHVNYRTGTFHDMAAVTRAAHDAGALVVWDLSHSAGALPVDLTGSDADFAIGCGYKYLNGGPGAPAFAWVHPRLVDRTPQPLTGWIGHARPFEFAAGYAPAAGIQRYMSGTPQVLGLVALEEGVRSVLAAEPLGGLGAIRAKSVALSTLFIDLVDARCRGFDVAVASPRDPARRASQVSLTVPDGAYAIMQALIARGVIGDFRAGPDGDPDLMRFGFTPLYTSAVDVFDAVEVLHAVVASGEWREARFQQRAAVT